MPSIVVPSNIYSILTYCQWKGTSDLPHRKKNLMCMSHSKNYIKTDDMKLKEKLNCVRVILKSWCRHSISMSLAWEIAFNDTELVNVVYPHQEGEQEQNYGLRKANTGLEDYYTGWAHWGRELLDGNRLKTQPEVRIQMVLKVKVV